MNKKIDTVVKRFEDKTRLKINKLNLKTEYDLQIMTSKSNLLKQQQEIYKLKENVRLSKPQTGFNRIVSSTATKVKRWSMIISISILILLMTAVSAGTSIAGGIEYFKNNLFGSIVFIAFIILAQLIILLITAFKPFVSTHTSNFSNSMTFVQILLLIVSISFNYNFLSSTTNSIIFYFLYFILCVLFDLAIILMLEIAFTIFLREYKQNKKSESANTDFKSRILNLFNVYINYILTKLEKSIAKKYNNLTVKNLDNDLEKQFIEFAKNNILENNQILSYKEISNNLKISEYTGKKIHNKLLNEGLIITNNKKTYLKEL